jgi:type II secretory pathway pseudopilin PulG
MNRKAVVWISTILYTMVSLAIIGLLLSVIQPKISQMRDSIIIDQTRSSLAKIDETVQNTQGAAGMKLMSELRLGKGQLIISGSNNSITWEYDSQYQYSEANKTIQSGSLYERTDKLADSFRIRLFLNYTNIDLKFSNSNQEKILQAAPSPYKLWFENKGNYIDITLG